MTDGVDQGKRTALVAATAGAAGVGTIAMVKFPFVDSWSPNAATKAAGAPVDVDITDLKAGDGPLVVPWNRRPVWIMRRDPNVATELEKISSQMRDPESKQSDQPEYATNIHRSSRPDVLVLVGTCTHLGCSPKFKAEPHGKFPAGFFCPCHGSAFDLAGRVVDGVPAPENMAVPPYRFIDENTVRIGENPEASA